VHVTDTSESTASITVLSSAFESICKGKEQPVMQTINSKK
jgi:hypothetical protein